MLKLSASCLLAELLVLLVSDFAVLVQLYHIQPCEQACGIPKCLEGIRNVCSCHCRWHHVLPVLGAGQLRTTLGDREHEVKQFLFLLLFHFF